MSDELLKLSQDFHKKIDTTFSTFNSKLEDVVQSHHETEYEVMEIGAEVKAVQKEVDGHIENHTEAKRDIKGVVYAVIATVIGAILVALIVNGWGG